MERIGAVLLLLVLALPTQAAVEMFYLHNDHLGTPRVVTNQLQQVVWKGHLKPFGETQVEIETITNHRRFPGQRFDIESRLHYNYFRDYDPRTGRYIQSDPIGLQGGFNTYGYVSANPVSFVDPMGLACTSIDGQMTCAVPNGPLFVLPSPQGQPAHLGPGDWFYHETNVSRELDGADPECVMRELIKRPTPGVPSPASADGTPNNAVPPYYPFDNPVTSYVTKDLWTGMQVVVNTAGKGDGSAFGPGYVAKYVQFGRAYTKGEGTSKQQGIGPSDWANEMLWGKQLEEIIKECKCK